MQWAAAAAVCDCNDLYDQVIIHRPTTYYHDFAPSSASAPFFRWFFCVEQTAWRYLRRIWHRKLSEASKNSLF